MSPTLMIPSVAPPRRASEPAGNPAAESEGGDAFADALQRAQGEPRHAAGKEPRTQTPKSADAQARTARHAQHAQSPTPESARQPADDAADGDAATPQAVIEATAGDAAQRSAEPLQDALVQPLPAVIAIEVPAAPQAAIEANRSEEPRAPDAEDPTVAIDARAAVSRPGSRLAAAPDQRSGPAMPARATLQNQPAGARDTAAALPIATTIEHAAPEAAAAPTVALRAPSFERPAAEPSASPLVATLFTREIAAAAAPSLESKAPQAILHAAIDEPGFGPALGTQVALWVRDGVQEARLQLHPAELGPVTVQIALEGQAAHVDFTAAVAATRESIEQSLPALAAALRESGFTLAGGGVSSHAGQGSGDGRRERAGSGPGNRSGSDAGADAGPEVSAPRRWTRSLLDVYA